MKTLEVKLPDQLAKQLEDLVQAGWFISEAELTRQALSDFIHRQRFQLQEQYLLEDIRWASTLKDRKA